MPNYMKVALTVFLWCGAIWFFRETLIQNNLDREAMREDIRVNTVIIVGQIEPCVTHVNLSAWESMNAMGIYRWVAACEEKVSQENADE